jgi:phage protein D
MQKLTAYISRPTVFITGQADNNLSNAVQSVLIEETTEGLFRCEALFNNYGVKMSTMQEDYLYADNSSLTFGTDFAIHLPLNDSTSGEVFKGKISGLEAEYLTGGGALLTVLAEDQLQSLRMTRRTRTFEDLSDENVMRQIATEHSLTPMLTLPPGPAHKILAQVNQSNLAFMRERARNIGVELWVAGKTLYAQTRTDRAGQAIELAYGANLYSFSVRADLAHQCTAVHITGWDIDTKESIDETGEQSAIQSELEPGNSSSSSILQRAFGERKEYIVHTVPLTSEEAQSIAIARYRERARRFVTGTGIARGDGRIRVGCKLSLGGLGSLFNGTYYVTAVRHGYDGVHGYRTTFEVERPGIQGL